MTELPPNIIQYIWVRAHYHHRRQRGNTLFDVDDFFQQAVMKCLEQIDRFDPSRGLRLLTFLSHRIDGSMVDMVRSSHGHGMLTKCRKKTIYIVKVCDDLDHIVDDRKVSDELRIGNDVMLSKMTLRKRERRFIELYRQGFERNEIAEMLGCTKQNIQHIVNRLQRAYKSYLEKLID